MSANMEALSRAYSPAAVTVEWGTPQELFDGLSAELGPFTLDVAASTELHLCEHYFTKGDDGLSRPWFGRVWCNPPYGRSIRAWIEKATREIHRGRSELVCMLLPARTDTRWFHDLVMLPVVLGGPSEVRFLRGRLRFVGASAGAPFASMVVIWRRSSGVTGTRAETVRAM
jgi:site-specific DNA-methyltransferase (adenine-specific)